MKWTGSRVKALRENYNLTQATLVSLIGGSCCVVTVSRWETHPDEAVGKFYSARLYVVEEQLRNGAKDFSDLLKSLYSSSSAEIEFHKLNKGD